ncbi:MAG: MFS transporter [Candidatus Rokuibacteriota bacterium]|nr:MAG: MFS transporter [Candidatus Rokubacteria bacterium]
MVMAARLGALEEREFRLFWLGQATSALGTSLVPVALAFAVIDLTGSASDLGIVLSAGLVSRVGLLLFGGVVADRLPRQSVMLAADLLRTGSQAAVALLLISEQAQIWELLVLFALYGAGDAFFSPASTGLVPDVVRAERLQQANALMSLSRSVAWVAGPTISGVLVAGVGPGWVFAVDAATFAVSSASLALLRLPRVLDALPRAGVIADLRGGWHEVRSRTWVWLTVARFSLSNLAITPIFVLGPFVAQESLGGAKAWGLIGTAGGIGAVLGDAAALRLRPLRPLFAGTLAVSLWALEPALLALPASTWAIAAAAALGLGGAGFSNALWFTALQERIPREALSRVSSYDWLGSIVFQPAGYALAGPVSAAIGTSATLLAGAVVQASACLGVALTPEIRGLRRPG